MAALLLVAPALLAPSWGSAEIRVLSNRPDLISGGDALVEVTLPLGTDPAGVVMDLDGADVTHQFGQRPSGRYLGLLTGLSPGENVLSALFPGGGSQQITITNHPKGGPIFSGEQHQPWICETEENGFGPPQDEFCNVDPQQEYLYLPVGGTSLQPYDVENPPALVANTTTDEGVVVPFIVRQETGVLDRGWYSFLSLYDPHAPGGLDSPQQGWNGKLVVNFGGSCGTLHSQGAPPDPFVGTGAAYDPVEQLAQGFAVAVGWLMIHGNSCSSVISAEQLMMIKERLSELHGDEIRYTIGTGCSGGSMLQQHAANAYPGLLDGIIPNCSFTETDDMSLQIIHSTAMENYFLNVSPHLWLAEPQRAAVYGSVSSAGITVAVGLFGEGVRPSEGCGFAGPGIYDPDTNPDGTRCTYWEHWTGVYGSYQPDDPPSARTIGFGRRAWDNEGFQYGLVPLLEGVITPEQFVDLNEKVGSVDLDGNIVPYRWKGDGGNLPAFEIAYRSGGINDFRRIDRVPVIDVRGSVSSNLEFHPDYQSYRARARLDLANGHHDNQIILTHAAGTFVTPPSVADEVFDIMDRWLAGIEADESGASLEQKVLASKPADAVDACYVGEEKITDPAVCATLYPYYGDTETAAGQDLATMVVKCQLEPLDLADYASLPVPFTLDQWARLQAVFPDGVCDYSLPGVGQVPSVEWLIHDGEGGVPAGPAPVSTPGP